MDCTRVRELLPEFGDGRLGAGQVRPIEEHVTACAACGRELAVLRGTWDLLKAYPPIEADVAGAVQRRIRNPFARALRILAPLAAAAAILIVATAVFLSPPGGATDSVEVEVGKLAPEDRALLTELAKDEDRELIENLELLRALEFVGADQLSADHPFNGH